MEVFVPMFGIVFGYWIGAKMEEWAQKKIWNLTERSDQRVRFIRFLQWAICFLLLVIFAILSGATVSLLASINF